MQSGVTDMIIGLPSLENSKCVSFHMNHSHLHISSEETNVFMEEQFPISFDCELKLLLSSSLVGPLDPSL